MFGPLFCPSACCSGSGPFDLTGDQSGFGSTVIYLLQPSSYPAGWVDANSNLVYDSADEGFFVDYSAKGAATIVYAMAPYNSDKCWVVRTGNPNHPDDSWGSNLLDGQPGGTDWTNGADLDRESGKLVVTTDAATSAAYTQQGVSLTSGDNCRLDVLAEPDEALYLKVEVRVGGSAVESYLLDLTGGTLGGGDVGDTLTDAGDGRWLLQAFFTAASTATHTVRLSLVDSGGATITNADGDGLFAWWAQLRKSGSGPTAWDISRVDHGDQAVEYFVYPRLYPVGVDVTIADATNALELDMVGGADWADRRVQAEAGFTFDPGYSSETPLEGTISYPEVSTAWSAAAGVGFLNYRAYESFDDFALGPALDLWLRYGPGGTLKDWGARVIKEPLRYPHQDLADWGGEDFEDHYPFANEDASVPNGGEDFADILGASPHGFPFVWGIKTPRFVYYTHEDPGVASGYYVKTVNLGPISQQVVYTCGAPQVLENVTVTDYGVTYGPWPVIVGADTAFWSAPEFAQERVVDHSVPHLWGVPYYSMKELRPHQRGGISLADHDGTQGIAICWWTNTHLTITTYPLPASSWPPGSALASADEQAQVETVSHEENWAALVQDGSVLFGPFQWWRKSEAYVPAAGPDGGIPRITTVGVAHGGLAVWGEALFSVAPTEGDAGTLSGYRLHIGPRYLDSDPLTIGATTYQPLPPEFWQSSHHHVYVQVRLPNAGSGAGYADHWVITLDGRRGWEATDWDLSVPYQTWDAVKAEIEGVTPPDDYLGEENHLTAWHNQDEEGVQWPSAWTADAAASFSASRLELIADATATADCEITAFWWGGPATEFRIHIEAQADQVEWLRLKAGTGDYATCWLNLASGSVASASGVSSSRIEDLGGGRYRFVLTIDGAAYGGSLTLRAVDSSGATTLTGLEGDGCWIYRTEIYGR